MGVFFVFETVFDCVCALSLLVCANAHTHITYFPVNCIPFSDNVCARPQKSKNTIPVTPGCLVLCAAPPPARTQSERKYTATKRRARPVESTLSWHFAFGPQDRSNLHFWCHHDAIKSDGTVFASVFILCLCVYSFVEQDNSSSS